MDKITEYKKFCAWCENNKYLDLDPRLHTHAPDIAHGGYISHEKTRIAFNAWVGAKKEEESNCE